MAASADVWIVEPGRARLPVAGMAAATRTVVPHTIEWEDRTERWSRLAGWSGDIE